MKTREEEGGEIVGRGKRAEIGEIGEIVPSTGGELKESRRKIRAETENLVGRGAWRIALGDGDWDERVIAVDWIIRWDGRDRGLDDWLWTLRGFFVEKMMNETEKEGTGS